MALKIAITTPDSTEHPNAYVKIYQTNFAFENNMKFAIIIVDIYDDEGARIDNALKIQRLEFWIKQDMPAFTTYFTDATLLLVGNSPLKNAYKYLKALPEFSNAVDI